MEADWAVEAVEAAERGAGVTLGVSAEAGVAAGLAD